MTAHRSILAALAAAAVLLTVPAIANAGHGLKSLDHPYPAFQSPSPPPAGFQSGGPQAEWDLVGTVATGNPHTDLDFFQQDGETYATVGTLGVGPNAGGQTIVQLTDGGEVNPRFVTGHPSAACLSDPSAATGLQHDVEATPKGGVPLNSRNPYAAGGDAQLLIDATDAPGRCHDQGDLLTSAPRGGLELVDITDVESPVEIGLTTHIGEAHTVNVDPKRPHIAYVSSSDRVGVTGRVRENEDPEGDPLSFDGIEVVDMSSCMNFKPTASLERKRERCKPKVYRYRWPTTRVGLGHTDRDQVWGCHELEVYPSDLVTCGAGSALIALDMSRAFDDRGTPDDFTDDVPRGRALPCRRRASSSLAPFATGAKVVDCVDGRGEGTTDLSVPEWIAAGKPSLKGVRWLGSIRHMGRGSGGAGTPTYDSTQDIDFNHEAELSASGRLLLATDERGGGVLPPDAACSPEVDNKIGNGGVHAYRFNRLRKRVLKPKRAFRAYARTPKGKKAIFRTPVRTQPQASLCTAHVFQQIPGQNRIFMGWYSQGTHVLDFREKRNGRVVFKEAGYLIPADANTWTSHVFDWKQNPDGSYTYWGATGDFNLGAAGRSAIDVYEATLPAPPKPRRIGDVSCKRGRWQALMHPSGRPFTSRADCRSFAR